MLPFKETTESNYIIEYNKKDLVIKKIKPNTLLKMETDRRHFKNRISYALLEKDIIIIIFNNYTHCYEYSTFDGGEVMLYRLTNGKLHHLHDLYEKKLNDQGYGKIINVKDDKLTIYGDVDTYNYDLNLYR